MAREIDRTKRGLEMTETTDQQPDRDARGRWAAGNPGRPRGARNAATEAALALLDGEAANLTRRAIDAALAGDAAALRLCLERILPPRAFPILSLPGRIRPWRDSVDALPHKGERNDISGESKDLVDAPILEDAGCAFKWPPLSLVKSRKFGKAAINNRFRKILPCRITTIATRLPS
jgi:hypothetical protein